MDKVGYVWSFCLYMFCKFSFHFLCKTKKNFFVSRCMFGVEFRIMAGREYVCSVAYAKWYIPAVGKLRSIYGDSTSIQS